jgi:hypothetical protein
MDIDIITRIPLSTRRHEDVWAWHFERSGVLSVRSVYRMIVRTRQRRSNWLDERASGSHQQMEEKAWKNLWKVHVPSKLRVFLWRLAHQSLPTGDVRHRRHMSDSSSCSVCGADDSWRHSLLECTMSRGAYGL